MSEAHGGSSPLKMVITITNEAGTEIDYEAAVNLMDPAICERTRDAYAGNDPADFFKTYCYHHRETFGEEFEPNKANPVW